MICLETVKKFCTEYWKIENYDQAVADKTQTWHCHHRHEINWALPKEELIAIGRYYDVHYSELIFLTPKEHVRLHHTGKPKPKSEEHKTKISEGKIKYHSTAEELYDLYVAQGLSAPKIAALYGCSETCIRRKLKKYNLSENGLLYKRR